MRAFPGTATPSGNALLRASVAAAAYGAPKPTGTVTIKDGSQTVGTLTLGPSGMVSVQLAKLTQGQHTLTMTYSGDANYLPDSANLTLMVWPVVLPLKVHLAGPPLVLQHLVEKS